MKLILTQEVEGLGAAGDVVEVKDGYGRNYLLPRGVAVRWTRGGQKQVDALTSARSARAVRDQAHAEQIKTKLEQSPVSIQVRAGNGGRLFGSVTTAEIATALTDASGESVDKRTIVVPQPIRALGVHQVSVRLHDDVAAAVALNVVPA